MPTSSRPLAVVTGASTGIGFHLARIFAENGYDLLITAEEDRIQDAARDLESTGAVIRVVKADLTKKDEVARLWNEIAAIGQPVDAIALNAGVGPSGSFVDETDLDAELDMIRLNVLSTVQLAKHAAKQMAARGSGRILITSSIAGTSPTPYHAVYGATKAFLLEFSQSLYYELKDRGVTVTALKPGATDTEFFSRAEMEDTAVGSKGKEENDPADVAQQGYDALMAGDKEVFAASFKTKVEGTLGRFIPDSVKASMYEKQAKHQA
jgi:short-subunit dehydrogenase